MGALKFLTAMGLSSASRRGFVNSYEIWRKMQTKPDADGDGRMLETDHLTNPVTNSF